MLSVVSVCQCVSASVRQCAAPLLTIKSSKPSSRRAPGSRRPEIVASGWLPAAQSHFALSTCNRDVVLRRPAGLPVSFSVLLCGESGNEEIPSAPAQPRLHGHHARQEAGRGQGYCEVPRSRLDDPPDAVVGGVGLSAVVRLAWLRQTAIGQPAPSATYGNQAPTSTTELREPCSLGTFF